MEIEKTCQICGKTFFVPHWRGKKAKYCSRECSDKSHISPPNTICTNCGKHFHMKESRKNMHKRNCGYFCSRSCFAEYKKVWFKGENNHQYGLKGKLNSSFKDLCIEKINHTVIDLLVYFPNHPHADKHGRVLKHRLVVEQNHELFDESFFENINGMIVLKKNLLCIIKMVITIMTKYRILKL